MGVIGYKKQIKRFAGNYRYVHCKDCGKYHELERPQMVEVPYCSVCNKVVLDGGQKFCCWCGARFKY